jgi:serine/threonine protein kinase
MEPRIGNKFRVGRKLGSGSFGEIYLGTCPPRSRRQIPPPSQSYRLLPDFFLTSSACLRLCVCAGTNVQTNEEVAIKLVSLLLFLDVNYLCDFGRNSFRCGDLAVLRSN